MEATTTIQEIQLGIDALVDVVILNPCCILRLQEAPTIAAILFNPDDRLQETWTRSIRCTPLRPLAPAMSSVSSRLHRSFRGHRMGVKANQEAAANAEVGVTRG